jgi:sec-independent protein translocase protein TatA
MPSLGPAEILVILVVALLVFGPNKMPEIARQVGKGFREFRRVQQHLKSELRDVVAEFDSPSSTPTVDQQALPTLPPKEATTDAAEVSDAPAPAPPTLPGPTAAPSAADTSSTGTEPDAPSEPA